MSERSNRLAWPAARSRPAERRTHVRYPCTLAASCRLSTPSPVNVCAPWTRDLSAGGVGLFLSLGIEPATLVSLQVLTAAGRISDPLPARVVHATAQPDGGWVVGCTWEHPLEKEELWALMAEPA